MKFSMLQNKQIKGVFIVIMNRILLYAGNSVAEKALSI